MFALINGTRYDLTAILHGAGRLNDDIDDGRISDRLVVSSDCRSTGVDQAVQLSGIGNGLDIVPAGLQVGPLGIRKCAVGDCDKVHAWHTVDDLIGQTAAHEAGTYQRDPNWSRLRSTFCQC